MRYVPSIPPLVSPADTEGVKLVERARPVRPVSRPIVAPIVITHYRRPAEAGAEGRADEDAEHRRAETDRRIFCRRVDKERDKLLLDSRADQERRRNNRRQADIRTNVDEEI